MDGRRQPARPAPDRRRPARLRPRPAVGRLVLTHVPPWNDAATRAAEAASTAYRRPARRLARLSAWTSDDRRPIGSRLMTRIDGRTADQLRPVTHHPRLARPRRGLVLVEFGRTRVLCTASFTAGRAALAQGQRAGLGDRRVRDAAALDATPAATASRSAARSAAAPTRSPGWSAGRCAPSSTLGAGREHRSCSTATCCRPTAAPAPPRSPARTSRWPTPSRGLKAERLVWRRAQPLTGSVAAVSVGIVGGEPLLDLHYDEDVTAETDMNVV